MLRTEPRSLYITITELQSQPTKSFLNLKMFYLMIATVWMDESSVFSPKLMGQEISWVNDEDSKFLLVAAFRMAFVRQDCFQSQGFGNQQTYQLPLLIFKDRLQTSNISISYPRAQLIIHQVFLDMMKSLASRLAELPWIDF